LAKSSKLNWVCGSASNIAWETLDVDFHFLSETGSILNGTITMEWNQKKCLVIDTPPPFATFQNQQKIASRCFNPATVTSKIPCSIGPTFAKS
jgi:hypothetical protein